MALACGLILAGTIYELHDLHRASTDRKEGEDSRSRFATEFRMVKQSSLEAVKKAWRDQRQGKEVARSTLSKTVSAELTSPPSAASSAPAGGEPEDLYDDPPPAASEVLGQCILYRNADICETWEQDCIRPPCHFGTYVVEACGAWQYGAHVIVACGA